MYEAEQTEQPVTSERELGDRSWGEALIFRGKAVAGNPAPSTDTLMGGPE